MSVANLQLAMMVEELCDELTARGVAFHIDPEDPWLVVSEASMRSPHFFLTEGIAGCGCGSCMDAAKEVAPAFYAKYLKKNEVPLPEGMERRT